MKKIAIIWPVYPWRGGIAHHTSVFAHYLGLDGLTSEVFSFSYQYPSFLYPGKFQKESWENPFPDLKVNYILNTINPITWWHTYRRIVQGKFSVCVFKYWHFYFVPCFLFIAFFLKRKNIKIICIIDNLYAHEGHFLNKVFAKAFFSFVGLSITQSVTVDNQFSDLFPLKNHIMLPHPIYNNFGSPSSQLESRKHLSLPLDKKILLFFGFIRYYKGLDIFLTSMPKIIESIPNIHLVIAGECFWSFKQYEKIILENNLKEFITCHIKYVDSADMPFYFSAADAFIMPYRSATNSGVMEIAKFYELPVLASNMDSFQMYKWYNGLSLVDMEDWFEISSQIKKIFSQKFKKEKSTEWPDFVDQFSRYV